MRRRMLVLPTVLGALLLAPGAASAQVAAEDSVTGSGTTFNQYSFDISARSGPSGENPTGQVSFRFSDGSVFFDGPVTCLSVRGNVAGINVATTLYGTVGLEVTDLPTGDLMKGIPVTSGSPCTAALGITVDFNVATGDVAVRDAPPLPTTTAQCKHGGWRTYAVFKNQGACVSFVARGGRA